MGLRRGGLCYIYRAIISGNPLVRYVESNGGRKAIDHLVSNKRTWRNMQSEGKTSSKMKYYFSS